MRITLIKTKKLGLDVYQLYYGASLIGQYMSEEFGRTAYQRLINKLNKGE